MNQKKIEEVQNLIHQKINTIENNIKGVKIKNGKFAKTNE